MLLCSEREERKEIRVRGETMMQTLHRHKDTH